MSEEPVTISISSDEDEDGSFFRQTKKKPRLSSIKGINCPSSSTSKKQPKKVRDKIDVVIVSESQRNIEDFVEFKKRYAPEKKLKNELPNPKSHKFFKQNQNHSITKIAKPPDSPDCVVLDPDADNLKSDNLTDIICNLTNISPNKSGALEKKSKILEEEFSTENKNDKMPKPSIEENVFKPKSEGSLKRYSFETNKNKSRKGQVTKDWIRKSFVNGCKKIGNNSKHIKIHEKKPIEVVNLDDMNDVPDKEKDEINEAVQEEKGAMDCMDNETTNSEKTNKDQKEVGCKDVSEKAEIKENEKQENIKNEKVNCEESKENEGKRKRKNKNENNNNTKDDCEAKRVKIEETCATNVPEIYNEFLALLESLEDNKEDKEKALKKLSKYHSLADPTYTSSSEFKQFLKEVCNIVKNNSMELYPTLHTIFARLKKRRQKPEKKVLLTPAPEVRPSTTDKAEILKEMINPEEVVQTSAVELKNRRAVRRLSKTLQKLEKKIKQIEQIDVDLDDENDSSYLRMQTYRQRFCQVYKKLCEYTGDSPEAGRVCKSKIPFNGTKSPAVNKCIEKWLNRKKVFPDFTDILKLIEEQNKVDKLNLTPEGIRTLATDAFTKVGEMLQRIRIHDFWNTYSEYLDVGEDPADKDPQLQESLRRNKEASSKKIAEILDHYCERQVKEHYVAEEVPDEEADRSPAESGDEDEKEIEEVENSLIEDYNALSEDEAKPDEEQNSNGKSKKHPSAGENSTEPDAAQPPTGETVEKPEEATAIKESKNNYKHCKSLKWRRENNLNVSSDLSSEDNKKPGSDEKTGSDSNSEKNEIFINKEPVDADKSAEGDKPVVESKTDSIEEEEVTVRKEDEEEDSRSKDFECEVIEVDQPVIKSSDKIYEQLKNNFNAQPFFVNYVRVEYFSKELQRESFKNPFDRSSGYALRDSTNLDEIIHLKDEGFRDNFKNSKKNKENRSFNYLKSKKLKTFNVPYKKRARKNIFITKCVSENKENNGTSNGEERGKEKEQSHEGEEKNEEAEEAENSAGNNGSGNGRDDDDEGGEDKDSKGNDEEEEKDEENEEESEKHEEEEVNETHEEEEMNEKCEEKEVNEKHEEENANEKCEEEEANEKHEEEDVNDKHEEEEEIEKPEPEEEDENFEQENGCGHEEDRMNGNYDAETDEDSVDLNGKAEKVKGTEKEYDNDFDKKLKAFEDALEFDEEEEPHGNIEEKEPEEKRKTEFNDNNGEEVDEKMGEDPVDTNEDEANDRMEGDNDRENGEDQVYENGEEEQPSTNSEIDPDEKMEDHSNDSVEKNKNENEEDIEKEDKTDEPMLEQEEKKSPGENGDDASEKSGEAAPESKENEETINDCKQDDSVDKIETKTESEDTNETESKTDEDDGESSGKKPDGEEEISEDVDSKPGNEESGEASEEQTKEDSTSLEPSEDLGDEEPGPSSKRKANETTDVEVLSVKKPKTSAAKTDPLDEEIVQNFLRHSPSSISITPPKKFSKPPSQEALNALATLRQMKSISTTRVSRRGNEDDVQVIGESSIRRISNNGPVSITRVKRNQAPQPNSRSRGVPVISNVQSINRNNSLTPKIVTVQGNVSSFHSNRNFNFGMPNRMINNMNQMNMNMSRMNIPGFNHFPGFNSSRFNNFSMFNNRQQPPLKISNVRGNITQTFRPQLHQQQRQQQQQPRRFVNPSATNVRPAAPAPSSTVTKDKSKKPVEYVVLE